MQHSLGRKSSTTWKYSKTFSPAELSYLQIINNMEIFKSFPHAALSQPHIINNLEIVKDIFTGRDILVSNNQQHGNFQSSFWPAELFQPQIIIIPKKFKDFFECGNLLDADQRYPETFQRLCHRQKNLSRKSSTIWKYSKTFHLQNSLSRKSSTTWKNSKPFSPAKLSWPQIIKILKLFKDLFSPAELSQPQIIETPKIFKDFFACRLHLAANHQQHGNIQRPFTCRIHLAANHQQPGKIQSLFHLQNCLGRKSSISRKHSQIFSPSELSWPQIIDIPKRLKDFFACRIVLAANQQQNGNSQRHFHRQNCLGRRSQTPRRNSKTFSVAEVSQPQIINNMEIFTDLSPAEFVQPQIINNLEISRTFSPAVISQSRIFKNMETFKDFFDCRIVLAADQRYPEIIQRLFHRQKYLSRKSSTTWKYSKTFHLQNSFSRKSSTTWKYSKAFSPAKLSWPQIINIPKTFIDFFAFRIVLAADHRNPENIQRLFHLQKYLSRKSSTTWKHSKTFSPAETSWPQIIDTPKVFKHFFSCRTLLAANHQQPGSSQRHFHRQENLSLE